MLFRSELPAHIFEEMMHFFEVYKKLEHKITTVENICHTHTAVDIVRECIKAYDDAFGKKKKK